MNRISLTIESYPENVALVGLCVKEIAGNYFTESQIAEIEQALIETVNNCIEHAYSDGEGQITIKFTPSKERLIVEIIDQGKKFKQNCFENLDCKIDFDPLDLNNLPEGGFGLKVIKSCMDEVNYRNDGENNYWFLSKNVTKL